MRTNINRLILEHLIIEVCPWFSDRSKFAVQTIWFVEYLWLIIFNYLMYTAILMDKITRARNQNCLDTVGSHRTVTNASTIVIENCTETWDTRSNDFIVKLEC